MDRNFQVGDWVYYDACKLDVIDFVKSVNEVNIKITGRIAEINHELALVEHSKDAIKLIPYPNSWVLLTQLKLL